MGIRKSEKQKVSKEVGRGNAEPEKVGRWEVGKDRGALRLRSTSFEERPGGLEKKGGRGNRKEVGSGNAEVGKTEGEKGSGKWECGSGKEGRR